jgi:hypothetical protein
LDQYLRVLSYRKFELSEKGNQGIDPGGDLVLRGSGQAKKTFAPLGVTRPITNFSNVPLQGRQA